METLKFNETKEIFEKFNGTLTLNGYGVMLNFEDPVFVESLALIDKSSPVADIAVAYGFSTKRLLKEGFSVYANDLSDEMLQNLRDSIDDEQANRLIIRPGNALHLQFETESLSAVICLEMIHFLRGHEIRKLFRNFYEWLKPGGVFVVACLNPIIKLDDLMNMEREISENIRNNLEWPGEVDIKSIKEKYKNNTHILKFIPDFLHFVSLDVLIREVTFAGFNIYKASIMGKSLSEARFTRFSRNKHNFSSIIAIKDISQLNV